ncbi:cache domain-containing sensor histidine kinase [Paenibacillus chungangensis]|uniref:histidine kinase n=1 Tax=Paenibacillus chungangensis TaxID=696535 RepID=A0ABW3HQ95_9BACL
MKLFAVFCAVSFIPLFYMASIYYKYSINMLETEIGKEAIEQSSQAKNRLDSYVSELIRTSNMIRYDSNIKQLLTRMPGDYDPETVQSVLETKQLFSLLGNIRDDLEGIFFVNDNEFVVYGATRSVANTSYPFYEQDWLQNLMYYYKPAFSPIHPQDYVDGRPVLSFASNVKELGGLRNNGMLILDFSPDTLYSKIVPNGDAREFLILTNYDEWLGRKEPGAGFLHDPALHHRIRSTSSGYFPHPTEGGNRLIGFHTSESTGWKVLYVLDFGLLIERYNQIRFQLFGFVLVATGFIVLAALGFSKSLTKPLRRMERMMKEVEKGDLTVRFRENRSDEIGRLGKRFNQMLVQLKLFQEQVYAASEKEYKLKMLHQNAQMQALQAQINPHFLYNSLNTITVIGEIYHAREIVTVSNALSDMFRYSMTGERTVMLKQELQHVQAYLSILQVRYIDRFQCDIDVAPSYRSCIMLKLILQPIVENCMVHGFHNKREQGKIVIRADRSGDRMHIRIQDNGSGMSEEELDRVRASLRPNLDHRVEEGELRQGIGLRNVSQRLHLHYGQGGGLHIDSKVNEGTTVHIVFPLIKENTE